MDKQMSRWVIEFVIRKGIDDRLLERLIAILPLDDLDFRSKKFLLLRRIQTEVSKGTVSEKILDLLEIVAELELSEPKVPSETMRAAYCAVAVGCTVKFLELEDTNMYSEALQRIWRCRVPEVGKCDISGLISDKLLSWKDDLEAASSSVEIRNKVMSKNTIYEALKAVKCYVAELWNEMGPSFLEKTAELVYKKGKSVQELNPIGDEGLENVTEAHNAVTPTERPSVGNEILPSVQELNPIGDEGLENVTEAHNAVTPTERPSVGNEVLPSVQELNPIGDEGLENVTEAHNVVTPTEKPPVETRQKKGPQKRKHVGGHKKSFNKSGSKARISNVEELDIGTRMNQYPSFPTPEVKKVQTDLESSFVDLNAVVRDPLPEALKIAEEASSDIQRDTGGVDGNSGGEMNLDSTPKGRTDGVEANTIENIRDNDHPQGEERPNGNPSSTIDPLEFSEESLPNRPHLRNPRRTVISPLKIYSFPKIEKRRQKRKWTVLEEDTLRKGVQNFGRGNWKAILMEYRDIFEERTEVDLKDKWRNLTRYSS